MARANRRENIFPENVDWQLFIKTLAEACQKSVSPIPTLTLIP